MAGAHTPVLCKETIDLVMPVGNLADDCVFLDATFGRGGHARALLARLPPTARFIAADRDPAAVECARQLAREDHRVRVGHARFSELAGVFEEYRVDSFSGAVMDLGVSSPQLDEAHRGFSFRSNGPLDMRMDPSRGVTAAEWLNEADEKDIALVLHKLGEERFARRIARAIVAGRPLTETGQLADLISAAVPAAARGRRHDATRSFQAIRMHVNNELEEIQSGLDTVFEHLRIGARLAVISFHSLEDRLVKQTFRRWSSPPVLPRRLPVKASANPAPARLVGKPVRASDREITANPRARSATLRVLERVA
ncbi:MAG: 16S rRNA (cytosine(1402)-N(4))-methyltransferase RsmH [Pseudomonadales bacterium]